MTLVKYHTQSYKIGIAQFDCDKSQFFCDIGRVKTDGTFDIEHTVYSEVMNQFDGYHNSDYDDLPKNLQKLWEKGQADVYKKAVQEAKLKYEFAPQKNIQWKAILWFNKLFGKSDYG